MVIAEFETLLKRTAGLDANALGSSIIARAVQQRLSACALDNTSVYLDYVSHSPTELQELIEAVVVPETWFFRDREAFSAMAQLAYDQWRQTTQEGALRLLSLPCATGEEPYSMAMALLDAGFPADRFRIDAVDISLRALTKAQRATYSNNSFRGHDIAFRDRYFERTPHGHRVVEAVREHVNFQQGNLFNEDVFLGKETYDFIFCRNALICFDRQTQDHAVKMLARQLKAKGSLFVGPSETGLMLSYQFVSAKMPLAIAFHKTESLPSHQYLPLRYPTQPSIYLRGRLYSAPTLTSTQIAPSGKMT